MVEWLTLIVTAVGLLFGGGWTLLMFHQRGKEKLIDKSVKAEDDVAHLQSRNIERIERFLERMDQRQSEHEKVMAQTFQQFGKEMGDLKGDLRTATAEWNMNRQHFDNRFAQFEKAMERITEVIAIGPNSVLVRDKKK